MRQWVPFVHWLAWNIDPKTQAIGQEKIPKGAVQGANSYHNNGYNGPCPPVGESHRYIFKLYALDLTLSIAPSSTKTDVEKKIKGHITSSAELTGLYSH